MQDLLLKEEVYAVIGAAIEVHRELGPGFAESVYQEAMAIELAMRGIPFEAQHPIQISYKGHILNKSFVPDFLCYAQIVAELKAQDQLASRDEAQVLNYLKATSCRVGLLLNFGAHGRLEWHRLVR
jgi:GxxExxY protein